MSNTNQPVKLDRPLDFICLTERTDGMGVITDIFKGAKNILADEQGAEEFNEPHRFTTMISYEWTSLVKGNNEVFV